MFNYTYDKNGVYIGNLSNKGEKYGITQYRFSHNYELAKKSFTITDGTTEHVITFEDKRKAFVDGRECEYESLKLQVKTYLVRLGYDAAVVDLQQNLITLIRGLEKDYFYGRIVGAEIPEGAAHVDAGDTMVETNVAWYLGCDRFVWHEFLDEKTVRVKWSPNTSSKNDLPYKATKINYPILLVDIWGYGPFYSDVPSTLERCIFLQDYDHMMTVGLVYCGGELPMMVTGFAKYMDEEEAFDKSSVAGDS
ncbi:MAG: hypothetical protein GXX89_10535 [Clostridiales bacterium]|jgi:hypothetical protein|nr:hypothetical protein [Clostridiales bacterium]